MSFKTQIEEDIQEYQEKFSHISNIDKVEWAFNFWVLDKLYSLDEEIITERIIDYNDDGVDCFVWHEDQLDLYLIQNKYFNEKSRLTLDYINNDFLTRALTALKNGTYSRSKELQDIYTKFSGENGFSVKLILYVTNDSCKTQAIEKAIKKFNQEHEHEIAVIYGLTDIENLYYREPVTEKKNMIFQLQTPNNGTTLAVNNEAYNLNMPIDAMYIMTPVYSLYRFYKQAEEEKYNIFDSNIRDYLGATGAVNKKIMETLKNPEERKNFFYYNNGITIIVKSRKQLPMCGNFRPIEITNPQIVNGCQTVSTINEVLSSLPEETLEQDFQNTFVIVKILVIPNESNAMITLRKNIVRYNNSQNAIDQKTFEASSEEFRRLQIEE